MYKFFLFTPVKILYGLIEIFLLLLLAVLFLEWIFHKDFMTDSKKPKRSSTTRRSKKLEKATESLETLNNQHQGSSVEYQGDVLMENIVMDQQQQTDEVKGSDAHINKKKIHLVDGEKGGVGKSLFCRVLLEYCANKGYGDRIQFVESDLSNPDVGSIYFGSTEGIKNYTEAEFTNEEKKRSSADIVFELAMQRSVIVNLPSNIYSSVSAWFERNQIFTLGQEHDIGVCKWFVCNGGYSSLDKFKESVNDKRLKAVTHIFVRNKAIFDDWSFLSGDTDLNEILARDNVLEIDFPQFDFEERNKVDAQKLTFGKALAENSGFGLLSKQRIKNFLRVSYEGLDKLNLLP